MTRRHADIGQGLVAAHVRGYVLLLDPSDFVDAALLLFPQLYDYRELDFLVRNLAPGDVFLDIGAHLGLYSLVAARAVGERGRVVAVEADPATRDRLAHTFRVNHVANASAVNLAVSDADGVATLGLAAPPLRSASSLLRREGATIQVPAASLLGLLRRYQLERVAGLKLDIEGYEYRVLARFFEEADPCLWPCWIITEFHADMLEQAGGNTLELLQARGYRLDARLEVNCLLTLDRPRSWTEATTLSSEG